LTALALSPTPHTPASAADDTVAAPRRRTLGALNHRDRGMIFLTRLLPWSCWMRRALSAVATLATFALCAPAGAQATGPAVGEMAPDFTIDVVTKDAATPKPFTLSKARGQVVVLAFFPKARTSGCTVQMENYRDQYAKLFNGGKDVTLIGISVDDAATLHSWAQEKGFPHHFGADAGGAVGSKYNANNGRYNDRSLFVVGKDGKIAYLARPFRQMADEAYAELGQMVNKAMSGK
jgi:peroxiredoxin Q/BCP